MKFLKKENYKNIKETSTRHSNECFFTYDDFVFHFIKNRLTKTVSVFVGKYNLSFSLGNRRFVRYKNVKKNDLDHKEYMDLFDYILSQKFKSSSYDREDLISMIENTLI